MIAEATYDLKCQHCNRPVRELNGFYEDADGWTSCQKNLPHKPMPEVPDDAR